MITSVLAGLSILIIGDSHLTAPEYLVTTLHDGLARQGAVVHSIGVCGSTPADWLKATPGDCGASERKGADKPTFSANSATTRPITGLLNEEKPDLVIVVMGDTIANYSGGSFMKTWAWQNTTQLTKAIAASNTACVWVGPAWGTEGGKYKKTSRGLNRYPTSWQPMFSLAITSTRSICPSPGSGLLSMANTSQLPVINHGAML
ncbi:hypothetical protein [Neopusillimonas aromaticivorans]|uniref:hypothetical protein n=1 Tax=Neopusillimonas aromaticivorans TaxID=2979868 RepID=UPI0025919B70|nr:hypothetical protein [Neopusillimonas aromaticivorans]WJJ94301.1 hypothetical protein N7E01_04480 [Neopusillimonas aromaticivorans]